MKIIRDGKEIELTLSELMEAHNEYELDCCVEDIKSIYSQDSECKVALTEDDMRVIAERALHNLSKNDMYFDAYWASLQYTFDDYCANS